MSEWYWWQEHRAGRGKSTQLTEKKCVGGRKYVRRETPWQREKEREREKGRKKTYTAVEASTVDASSPFAPPR
jgi:hypothetical protein